MNYHYYQLWLLAEKAVKNLKVKLRLSTFVSKNVFVYGSSNDVSGHWTYEPTFESFYLKLELAVFTASQILNLI